MSLKRLVSSIILSLILISVIMLISPITGAELSEETKLKPGHYAEYIARGKMSFLIQMYDPKDDSYLGALVAQRNESKLIFKWEIIDEDQEYYVVRVNLSAFNASYFTLSGFLKLNLNWNFSQTYLVNKKDRKTYFASNHSYCGYWPYWITQEEICNIDLIKTRFDRTMVPGEKLPSIGCYVETKKKILLANGYAPPPTIVFSMPKGPSANYVFQYFYEPNYGIAIAFKGNFVFPISIFTNSSAKIWCKARDFVTSDKCLILWNEGKKDEYIGLLLVVLYDTNIPWRISEPSISANWAPSPITIGVLVVGPTLIAVYSIAKKRKGDM